MKRRPKARPTPAQVAAACEFQSIKPPVTSRVWRIHWPSIASTLVEYQEPVTMLHVLNEHAAALGAEPLDSTR